MARLPRLVVPGHPHHIVQRGINGQALFVDDADRALYLRHLADAAAAQQLQIHGYNLLEAEVHLLATPATPEALSRTLQAVGRRYVAAFNRKHGRTGTLWEGRFRASVIEAETYFLPCLWRIERLTGGSAEEAGQWPWSSASHHLGRRRDPLITDHARYWALGNTPFERELAHRRWLDEGPGDAQLRALDHAALHGWALGSAAFLASLGNHTDRPLRPRPRGRPRKLTVSPLTHASNVTVD